MFDRVTIRVSDVDASARFYDTVLGRLGLERAPAAEDGRVTWGNFSILAAEPVTRRLHVGFWAPDRELVHTFWEAGLAIGAPDDGAPGPRPVYRPDYYGGFLLDPDGNSAEAVNHATRPRRSGYVDHLWIRVADVASARAFYRGLGFEQGHDQPDIAQFRGPEGSFSVVAGEELTENVELAFPARAGAPDEIRDPDGNRVVFAG